MYDSLNSFLHSLQTHTVEPPPWIFPTMVTYFQSGDFGSNLREDSLSFSIVCTSGITEPEDAIDDDINLQNKNKKQ